MKKRVWGPKKCDVTLGVVFSKPEVFRGKNKSKMRRKRIYKLKMREYRPDGGYPVYWVRRSKPYHTLNSELYFEECKHFWIEEFGD